MTITTADVALFGRPFIFMRHGESEANVADTLAGSLDVALTALGHQQAKAAAALLVDSGISAIYSSTLTRARDTAEYVAVALKLPVSQIAELGERNWGAMEGQPRAHLNREQTPAGGESPQQFAERVLRGCAQIEARGRARGKHRSARRAAAGRALGLFEPDQPYFNAAPVHIAPAGSGWCMVPIGNADAPI